ALEPPRHHPDQRDDGVHPGPRHAHRGEDAEDLEDVVHYWLPGSRSASRRWDSSRSAKSTRSSSSITRCCIASSAAIRWRNCSTSATRLASPAAPRPSSRRPTARISGYSTTAQAAKKPRTIRSVTCGGSVTQGGGKKSGPWTTTWGNGGGAGGAGRSATCSIIHPRGAGPPRGTARATAP